MSPPSGKAMRSTVFAWRRGHRRRVLEDFANAVDLSHFRKRYEELFKLQGTSDDELRDFQRELRGVWHPTHAETVSVKAGIDSLFQRWFEWSPRGDWHFPRMVVSRLKRMEGAYVYPNPYHFGVSLAWALVEAGPRLAKCRNSECPAPYFLRNRAKQQYCERKACAAYGQRQHKLKWWEKHKAEQLGKRKAERRRKARTASGKKSQRKRGK
jgi:hypothetical protein